jgi:nucleotide-binding universal stress UspA family protein
MPRVDSAMKETREAPEDAMFRRILCPVDFSEESRRALEHAAAIARAWNSPLAVLHVYQAPSPFDAALDDGSAGADLEAGSSFDGAANEGEAGALDALRNFAQLIGDDVSVTFHAVHGTNVRRPIVREAEALDVDLVVIGSHGRVGVERLLLGSTCDAVVRSATCSVLVVPPGAGPPHGGRFRRILCGIDFSAPSLRAFRYAMGLASEDAEVTLLHAIEVPPELHDRQTAAAFDVEAVRAAAEAAARRRLEALSPGRDRPVVRIRAHVAEGPAHRRILETALQQHADVIVLGTHGRNVLDRWIFGSNTRAVLPAAPCPVLAVAPA